MKIVPVSIKHHATGSCDGIVLYHHTRWISVVRDAPQSLYLKGKNPSTHWKGGYCYEICQIP